MSAPLEIIKPDVIGENKQYKFMVAQIAGDPLWKAFALGMVGRRTKMMFMLGTGGINEVEQDEAIRKCSAFIQATENGYGTVTTWHCRPELICEPSLYRCDICQQVCCGGDCRADMKYADMGGNE